MAPSPADAGQPAPQCPVPFCTLCDPAQPCRTHNCGVCSYWADNTEEAA